MKILFFSLENLNNASGFDRLLLDAVANYPSQGDRISIFTSDFGRSRLSDNYINNVLSGKANYYKEKVFKLKDIPFPTFSFLRRLYLMIRNTDVVYYVFGFIFFDLLVLLLKLFFKKRAVIGFHAPLFIENNRLHNIYVKIILRLTLKYYDKIHTVNKNDAAFFEQWGLANKTFYIPNGINMEKFLAIPLEQRFLSERLRFAFAGRLERQKSVDLLISVIHKLSGFKIDFYFAGSGSFEKEVKSLAEKFDFVKYLGFLNFDEMDKLYSQADIFVAPSRQEPFGIVIIEALASGLPVISSRTQGPMDLLEEGRTGWFISEVSCEAILAKITQIYQRWLEDKNCYRPLPFACRKAAGQYSVEKMVREMQQKLFS